jgi:hypothetical protein
MGAAAVYDPGTLRSSLAVAKTSIIDFLTNIAGFTGSKK